MVNKIPLSRHNFIEEIDGESKVLAVVNINLHNNQLILTSRLQLLFSRLLTSGVEVPMSSYYGDFS